MRGPDPQVFGINDDAGRATGRNKLQQYRLSGYVMDTINIFG